MPWPIRFGPDPRMTTLRPVGRADLALVLVGRVVVRRLGDELGRAGVDGLVGRNDAGRFAGGADLVLGRRPTGRRAGRRRSRDAWPGARPRVVMASKPDARRGRARSSTIIDIWSRNHGSIRVAAWTVVDRDAAAQQLADLVDAVGGRDRRLREQLVVGQLVETAPRPGRS